MKASIENHINELKSNIMEEFKKTVKLKTDDSVGRIKNFADGVAYVDGLKHARIGQKLKFVDSTKRAKEDSIDELEIIGVVEDIDEFAVKCLVFGEERYIKQEDLVEFGDDLLKVPVSKNMLGKVVDPFCRRIDVKYNPDVVTDDDDWFWWVEKEGIKYLEKKPEILELRIERPAPSIIDRGKINTPLQTGVKAIDATLPIGRGQRMLIIGDRSIGKTSIGMDMIINQNEINRRLNGDKKFDKHDPNTVYCVYVAIGKKASEISKLQKELKEKKALDYTIIVTSMANDPAPLLYICPFTGCTIGEYFRDIGRNALVIFDDLSKHANAYRQISLILKRPPGREAYPGDVFYLHSRLLERAARIKEFSDSVKEFSPEYEDTLREFQSQYSNSKGGFSSYNERDEYKPRSGGSLTAIPFVETKQGDYSSFIATNVISITDGQIFLSEKLKNDGIRPSIDIGLSVSRIGSSAQTNSMKDVSKRLKEVLAIYREKEKYSKFGMELNDSDYLRMERGRRIVEYFKQGQFEPISDNERQVIGLFAVQNGFLDVIPVSGKSIIEFEKISWAGIKEIIDEFSEIVKKINAVKDLGFHKISFDKLQPVCGKLENAQLEYFKKYDNKIYELLNEFATRYIQVIDEKKYDSQKSGFYLKVLVPEKQEFKVKYLKDISDNKLNENDPAKLKEYFDKYKNIIDEKFKNYQSK